MPELAFGFEGDRSLDLPRPVFQSVRTCSAVVLRQARLEIASDTGVMNCGVALTDEDINIKEVLQRPACQAVVFGALAGK